MLREINIEKIEKEETKKIFGKSSLPCFCGDKGDGRCGTKAISNLLYDESSDAPIG